ncbi:MAG TPA: helix-turn-helix domain-containing protein, partial [Acidobacteriota bacterium]|nr:helix-turn-helix domain-containing protein [Acidobacteriota bacterium]
MSPQEEVDVLDLPMAILRGDRQRSTGGMTWQQAREEFEREFLLRSLIENNGNVSRTAEAIGMERSHLHRKLKAYDINVRAQRPT